MKLNASLKELTGEEEPDAEELGRVASNPDHIADVGLKYLL